MAVLQGIEQFESKLHAIEASVRRKVLRTAMKQAVERTRARAAELAPVLTGRLKEHEVISVIESLSSADSITVRVGPAKKEFYGLFDEIGTAHAAAQPFLGPAFEETKELVYAEIAKAFIEALRNI